MSFIQLAMRSLDVVQKFFLLHTQIYFLYLEMKGFVFPQTGTGMEKGNARVALYAQKLFDSLLMSTPNYL